MAEKLIPISSKEEWDILKVDDTLRVYRPNANLCNSWIGDFTITEVESYNGKAFEVRNSKHASLRYDDGYIYYIVRR